MLKLSSLIRGPTKLEKIWQSIDIQCLSLSYSFWKGFEKMSCFSRCSKTLPTQNWRFFVFFSFFNQVKTTKDKQSYIFLFRQILYLHFCGYVFSCTIIFDSSYLNVTQLILLKLVLQRLLCSVKHLILYIFKFIL